MTFHGKQDLNAILRGETPIQAGDTFISESVDMHGFAAFRYEPKTPEPAKPHQHFKLPLAAAHGSADFDDYPEEYWDDEETCEMCGGDGVIEYLDHPEVWGEDCPSYENHLLPCPECRRRELAERRCLARGPC